MSSLQDFWKSKIQDTGGGNNEKSDLLTDSILEKRFNEAEQKSIQYNKKSKEETKIQNDNNNIKVKNDIELNGDFNIESNPSKNIDQLNENSNIKNIDNKVLEKRDAKKEILNVFTKKNKNNIEKLKENQKSETNKTLELKENDISVVEAALINKHNSNKTFEKTNKIQEKENINNNIISKIAIPKMQNKDKKEVVKLDTKMEFPIINKNETTKSEPSIIKYMSKKIKKEESKEEEVKKEPLIIKFEEKKEKKEPMTLVTSKKSKKEENLVNKKEEKHILKKIIEIEKKNDNVNVVNQTNMFEILPVVAPTSNYTDNDKIENNKTNFLKINEEIVKEQETTKLIQMTNSTKKNKKKTKHKKKKASSKENSYEEDIDLINKELDLNEKKNNKGTNQSKKKKKSKKKNNDIELHILTVKDNKTQLMKETQQYRLPLTAIAKKLIPENSGTTLGLKPVFPPDIEIEALCNVIVTKRNKKKKRDDLNLPFLPTKIGQLKSELENEKIDFNFIDEVNENESIERNDNGTKLMEQKGVDILKHHNMEVNMISSLKQIKRGSLKGKIELKNDNILEDIVEDFLDEKEINKIKENLNMSSESLIDMKITNEMVESQRLTELNKQISENESSSPNPESHFFVFQAIDALINTAEVYANALKKQIEEYERKDYNLEDSNKYSYNYKRKVKIYEAVLESIKDIREMGLSDYKNLEKLCFSDMKGDDNYEDNISNLLISVKYIMQELVLNVDEQEVLPQILTLNKNTNTLLSRMNGNKFKDSVLHQYKKLFEENHNNLQKIENRNGNFLNNNPSDNNITAQEDNKKLSDKMDIVLTSIPPHNVNPPKDIDKIENVNTISNNDMPEIIEPESLKMENQKEQPSTSNIELKIEYENEEVKNKIEKMSKSNAELLNSTEDILLELILKSQENQELKTKLISNCLNLDVNLAKKLATYLKMKGKDKEKSLSTKKIEISKFQNRLRDYPNPNDKVEITFVDGEIVVQKVSEAPNNNEIVELKKKMKDN
ncbi:hypothetical protein LY90DRAFT_500598 [Neocallimastix californiae]|uniref:Uncharacterized protein n=1 Tax=Neocallimastix californiae TaxID=1754190 RepID=A0A1Y2F6R7_9FUNG|nr:hypothetical protein LY90DRAFT_500598 [Neocallimastix californiae]|eukprot:ORY79588.1 hypothetical protein LY90DRAFT_500598 [Neocallimastix californiae]